MAAGCIGGGRRGEAKTPKGFCSSIADTPAAAAGVASWSVAGTRLLDAVTLAGIAASRVDVAAARLGAVRTLEKTRQYFKTGIIIQIRTACRPFHTGNL